VLSLKILKYAQSPSLASEFLEPEKQQVTKILLELELGVICADKPVEEKEVDVVVPADSVVPTTTCPTLPNPVADPLFDIVQPDGMLRVFPLAPNVRVEVPSLVVISSTSIFDIMLVPPWLSKNWLDNY
jgi:hypothetical protein